LNDAAVAVDDPRIRDDETLWRLALRITNAEDQEEANQCKYFFHLIALFLSLRELTTGLSV
jgi:hypothetical protein